ncbi:MAG: hypothetical protein ACPG05_01120 [Bdellovibrionales bacterium]
MTNAINIEEQRQSVADLVNLISVAAVQGDARAQRVMDDVEVILTTDWDDLPLNLRQEMAYVVAEMLHPSSQKQEQEDEETEKIKAEG